MKRKIFVLVMSVLLAAATLSGCKQKAECRFCAEIKKCDTILFVDEEVFICDDCRNELTATFD